MSRTIRMPVVSAVLLCEALTASSAIAADSRTTTPDGSRGAVSAQPLIGAKIYDPVPDREALFREWKRLGVNTAFVSTALAESGTFIPAARSAGFRTFVITPVFFNPEHLAAHPDAYAITGRGQKAKQDWVEFVCPSREEYRQERARYALDLLQKAKPDGLSLDFIRHFVFWEMVRPEARIDPLDTTCFCSHCLARFEQEAGVSLPAEAKATPQAAAEWLFKNQPDAWIRWRTGLITSWVQDVVREARRISPTVMINLHLVPWTESDYENGPLRVVGQDVRTLAPLVDYVSPMCYAHMLYREPEWIGRITTYLAARVAVPVLPSIEVKESYRQERLTEAFFETALRQALAPPSGGVVFWNWPYLSEEKTKQEILIRRGR